MLEFCININIDYYNMVSALLRLFNLLSFVMFFRLHLLFQWLILWLKAHTCTAWYMHIYWLNSYSFGSFLFWISLAFIII